MKKILAIAGIIVIFTLNACGSYEDCRGTYSQDHSPQVEQQELPA